jgi:hypothetical protein
LAQLGTQDTGRINVRENRRGQSRMDNPETQATLGTQDTGQRQKKKGDPKLMLAKGKQFLLLMRPAMLLI